MARKKKPKEKKKWDAYEIGRKILGPLCVVVVFIGVLAWPVLVVGSAFIAAIFGLAKKS